MTDDLAPLADAAHVLSRTLRRSGEQEVGLAPLPASEFEVLQQVVTHPGTTVTAVARAMGLQTSNVSTSVRALVGHGLLERVADPADQRRGLLHPAAKALAHRAQLEASWSRTIAAALETLPPSDARAIRAALPALTGLAKALSPR